MTPDQLGFVLHVGHWTKPSEALKGLGAGAVVPAGVKGAGTRETTLTGVVVRAATGRLKDLGWFALEMPVDLDRVAPQKNPRLADLILAAETWRRQVGLERVVFLSLHYDTGPEQWGDDGFVLASDGVGATLAGELVQSGGDVPIHLGWGGDWPDMPVEKRVSKLYLSLGALGSGVNVAAERDMNAVGKWLGRALGEGAAWVR